MNSMPSKPPFLAFLADFSIAPRSISISSGSISLGVSRLTGERMGEGERTGLRV